MEILLEWAVQPVGIIACLWGLTLLLWLLVYRARPTVMFSVALLSTVVFWILATPVFSNSTLRALEQARDNPEQCDSLIASAPLIVLSGGLDKYVHSTNPYRILSRDSLLRALRTLELLRTNTVTGSIYITGSVSHERNPSEIMAQVLTSNGVDSHRIVLENASLSTRDSAKAIAGLLPVSDTPVINLLTSASHTLRSALVFEKQGYVVCHIAGVDTGYSPAVFPVSFLPYLSGLIRSDRVLRESLALLVYRLKGYI